MKTLKLLCIIPMLFWYASANAQQDILVSQYMFSGMFLNPAYAGTHDYYTATGLFRKQWVGFKGAPTTQFLSIDGPLKNKQSGIGLTISHDRIGVTDQFEVSGNYAYHLNISENYKLSFGLKGTLSNHSANLRSLEYWDNDVVYENNISNKLMPNFGLGTYLFSEKTFVGISVPHLLSYDRQNVLSVTMKDAFKLVRSFYLHAGHAFVISPELALKPSTMLKYTPNTPFQADFNLNALIKERLWIGASYRTDESVVGIVEFLISKKFRAGYAYGMSVSKFKSYHAGSHEIMGAFDFGKALLKVKNPRYF